MTTQPWNTARRSYLVDSLDTVGIHAWQIDVINEQLEAFILLCSIHKALAVEDVGLYERLQLFGVGRAGEDELLNDMRLRFTWKGTE